MKHQEHFPPALAQRFLQWFLRDDLAEEVLGDLDEYFKFSVRSVSPWRAQLRYWMQVLKYIRPFAIRKLNYNTVINTGMFRNYINISLRNMMKSKLFSFINVGGMAISLASFLLIVLYVSDAWKYDRHIEDVSSKYRVYNEYVNEGGARFDLAMVPPMLATTLSSDFPEVEYSFRLMNIQSPALFKAAGKSMTVARGGYADPTVFDMFSLPLIEGDRKKALRQLKHLAISETIKKKYFGEAPALGQSMEVFGEVFEVAAVFKDCDAHAHFQMDYFLPMEVLYKEIPDRMQTWTWSQMHTYVKLKDHVDAASLERKFNQLIEKKAWPITKANGSYYIPHFMPMVDIYLHAYAQQYEVGQRGNIQTIYILCATAIFILFISILNFINLSTARAINRTKEVGVRKASGAYRSQLIMQFISEAVLTTSIALVMALLLVWLALPGLNMFLEKTIAIADLLHPAVIGYILTGTLLVGVLAGAYPAFIISSYKPTGMLTKTSMGTGKFALRQSLVVVQFVISFVLIMGAWIVNDQHLFMRNTNIGFQKDNLVVINMRDKMFENLELTKQRFLNQPGVESATLQYGLPGEPFAGDGIHDAATQKRWPVSMLLVDEDYIPTLKLELLAGRNFSKGAYDLQHSFIISEAASKMLGNQNPEDAIGYTLAWQRWDNPDSMKVGKVVGVVRDMQLNSMRDAISPIVLHMSPTFYSTITLKINSSDIPSVLAKTETIWKTFGSDWPFEFHFLDQNYDKMYKSEERLSALFSAFSVFTIIVACLGLFGLVMYSTAQRYKEIGIRKVLGAGEGSLMLLLSKNYLLLLAISFLLAIPISYYAATLWLERFVYHIPLSPVIFLKSGLIIIVLALITVVVQSLRAARSNPVSVLKVE